MCNFDRCACGLEDRVGSSTSWMGVLVVGIGAWVGSTGCASDTTDEEKTEQSNDELSGGPVFKSNGCTSSSSASSSSGPSSKIVCGFGCPAGYYAVKPLCISTCGGCNPYGRNAVQCSR